MLKKSLLLLFLLPLFGQEANAQKKVAPPWPGVPYSYAKVFLYNLDNQLYGQYQALKNGEPNFTLVPPGTRLNAQQVKELETILNGDTRVLNDGLSKCYEPHHAVFFYDTQDKIVAAFDVCFLCEGIRFYPSKKYKSELSSFSDAQVKSAQKQLEQIKGIFTNAGVPVFKQQQEASDHAQKNLVKNDTIVLSSDSLFNHIMEHYHVPFAHTLDEIKAAIGDVQYETHLFHESLNLAISELYYHLKGPEISVNVFCKGNHCHVQDLETKTKTNLFSNKFNIGMSRTDFNRIVFPFTHQYTYNNSVVIKSSNGRGLLLVHFDDKKQADYIHFSTH